ncbi:MAG: hypothetical protein R2795_07300 [Saprospiraceae bacterium]
MFYTVLVLLQGKGSEALVKTLQQKQFCNMQLICNSAIVVIQITNHAISGEHCT